MPACPAGDVVAALRKAAQHLMHEVPLAFRCVGQSGSAIEKQADDIVRRERAFDDQLAYPTPDRLDPSEANVEGNVVEVDVVHNRFDPDLGLGWLGTMPFAAGCRGRFDLHIRLRLLWESSEHSSEKCSLLTSP